MVGFLTEWRGMLLVALAAQGSMLSTTFGSVVQIEQWSLATGANGVNSGGASYFNTVTNPFVDSSQIVDRSSIAYSAFNFSWDDTSGNFYVKGSHNCVAQNPRPYPGATGLEQCVSEGGIYFTPSTDLLLTVDAAYDYNLAGPNLFTRTLFQVIPVYDDPQEPVEYVFVAGPHADTFTGYPATGTLHVNGQAIVPAGRTYLLSYSQYMSAYGNTGAVGTGNGYIHFTFAPVPEPAALVPLAIAVIASRQTRRSRRH